MPVMTIEELSSVVGDKFISSESRANAFNLINHAYNTLKKNADEYDIQMPFIAGGSVRDVAFGTQIKDVDFFLPLEDEDDQDTADYLLLGLQGYKDLTEESEYTSENEESNSFKEQVLRVVEAKVSRARTAQVITYLDNPEKPATIEEYLKRFHHPMVQISYDPESELFTSTDDFVEFAKNGKFGKKESPKVREFYNRNGLRIGFLEQWFSEEYIKEAERSTKKMEKILEGYRGQSSWGTVTTRTSAHHLFITDQILKKYRRIT